MRTLRVLVAGAAALAVLPAAATASNVGVDPATGVAIFRSGAAASDVTSQVTFGAPTPFKPAVPFSDAAQTLKAGAGCVAGVPVSCRASDQDVRFGGGNDRYFGRTFEQITVSGAAGDDEIDAFGNGTTVTGGAGVDTISVGSNGRSTANGNGGDDHLRSLGGIETQLSGGDGNDLVHARQAMNRVAGGEGDDDLVVGENWADVTGAGGADALLVLGDRGSDNRTLSGGAGPDTIVVHLNGADMVAGDSGDDTIDVTGGDDPDTVNCGAGVDTVYADPADVVARNCETRIAGPMPGNPLVDRALAHLAEAFPAA